MDCSLLPEQKHIHWMLKGCNLWRIRRHHMLEYGSFFIDESHTKSNDFSIKTSSGNHSSHRLLFDLRLLRIL
jgi:hypothetical protein